MLNYEKIIVRMPNWIGDLVMATPILHDLRYAFPKAHIAVLCVNPVAQILKKDPNINQIITFDRLPKKLDRLRGGEVIEKISKENFDLGVLLTNSISSAYWFYKAGVKQRLGFGKGARRVFLNFRAYEPDDIQSRHQVMTYKQILARVGLPPSSAKPMLYITKDEKLAVKKFINPKFSKVVGINPGAAYGSAKCWLPKRFAKVAKDLIDNDDEVQVIFFGTQETFKMCEEICNELGPRVVNLCGKTTIRELAALISQCKAFLTNDSGPMHMAAAIQVPLLALFGSTSDVKTGPYQWGEVIHKHVSCSPCYKRVCPIDFRCMKRISSDEVYDKLLMLVESIPCLND
ncbi:MAG: lipopolysaccharide heptosyltransferase II [Rhabdochlamydiaceae bacterium]|nr:lipopolysaccharide heptosyltransferase II [Candidatus Amphrikana amoebophyrae]